MNVTWQPRISSPSDGSDAHPEDDKLKLQKNSEGERYVDLGKKKRVTVRSFKGKSPLPHMQTC